MTAAFGWLGSHCSLNPPDEQVDLLKIPAQQRLAKALPDAVAQAAYHRRLTQAVFHPVSTAASVKALLDKQRATDRHWHAADIIALLCERPNLAVELINAVGLKDAGRLVGVGWTPQRRVSIDHTQVHVSPSGEGAAGPAMLWAGRDAKGLLGSEETEQPARMLTPKVVGFAGAITTLELLPAMLYSPVADELLTCPAIDAVMLAKWELLKPFWWLEFATFFCVYMGYLLHAIVDVTYVKWSLLVGASSCTVPLLVRELWQFGIAKAMRGVGNGRLSARITYWVPYNVLDLSGLLLVSITCGIEIFAQQLERNNSTLVAFTILLLSWKLISFLRINETMGFLIATLMQCLYEIRESVGHWPCYFFLHFLLWYYKTT